MKRHCIRSANILLSLLSVSVSSLTHLALAEEPIYKLEESWEIRIRAADSDIQAPQVTTVLTPDSQESGSYFVFNLNHGTQPEFSAGSMQVHCWRFDETFASNLPLDFGLLRPGQEHVTWTQSLELRDGMLFYLIKDGSSRTWGNFGGEEALRISMPSSLQNLNGYSITETVAGSEVGFAGNRVDSLVLQSVKYYGKNGLIKQTSGPVIVHQSQ